MCLKLVKMYFCLFRINYEFIFSGYLCLQMYTLALPSDHFNMKGVNVMIIEKHMLATAVDRCVHLGIELSHLIKVMDAIYYGVETSGRDFADSEQSCVHVVKEYLQMLYENDVTPLLEIMTFLDKIEESPDSQNN